MPEFLELVDSIRAHDSQLEGAFARMTMRERDERAVRLAAQGLHGHRAVRYKRALAEAAKLVESVVKGQRHASVLREAMTRSDFPLLFGDILDRTALGAYRATPTTYQDMSRRKVVRDFRNVKMFTIDGGEGRLDTVPEKGPYPGTSLTEAKYEWAVKKYGRSAAFSWEASINDDLDMLNDIPERFGKASRRTAEYLITDLYAGTIGPDSTFFANGNKNLINTTNGAASNNPALSIQGLQDGFTVLSKQVDADGEPIIIEMVTLVVPPALLVTAQNIINATEIVAGGQGQTGGGGVAAQALRTANWMRNQLRLVVNPYLPLITTTNGATSWYMFANPNETRPAVVHGVLAGHEEPEVFMKASNQIRVGGGGEVNAQDDGDWDNDGYNYKVRFVFGGSLIDPKMAVASNGSGS